MKLSLLPSVLIPCLLGTSLAGAGNWPQFRGPDGAGQPEGEATVPLEWSETENLKWKLALPGPGSSSPVVWGDRVYVTCYSGYGVGSGGSIGELRRHLVAVDRETGEMVWQVAVASSDPGKQDPFFGFISEHGYASHTPVTDGERIYCFFGKAGVFAYDMTGNEVWRQSVDQLHSGKRWGSASSPILHGDILIVQAGDEARAVYAFDTANGEPRWKAEGSVLEQTYGTPVLHRAGEDRTDLIVAGTGEVWGLNPATGRLRWLCETGITGNVSSSPLVVNDRVIVFGGYPRTMGAAIRLGSKGDVSNEALLWESVDVKSYMTAPLHHEGYLFIVRDEGVACCADPMTGELIYEERIPGASGRLGRGKPFYASPILVRGHLLAVSRTAGTFVIEAKPEFQLVRVNTIEGDEGRFQGTPAVSGGDLFLRSETALYCISEGN